jgi:hypothetical protein
MATSRKVTRLRKPTIVCDLDGVLADIEIEMVKRIYANLGIYPLEEKQHFFHLHQRYEVPSETILEFVTSDGCFRDPSFWGDARPYIGNVHTLKKWYDEYAIESIYYATGRKQWERDSTMEWLGKQGLPCAGLFMDVKDEKHVFARALDADFLIEDRHGEAVVAASYGVKTYLIEHKYNTHFKEDETSSNIIWVENIYKIRELEKF